MERLDREKQAPYAAVVIKLLQGTLEADDSAWSLLLDYRIAVREHFESFGVALHLDEVEGYAYLTQPEAGDDEVEDTPETLPRLVRRQKLSYNATLLCVLLRERLVRFDQRELRSTQAVVSKSDIQGMLTLFLEERTDEKRVLRTVDTLIRQVTDLGFLKKLSGDEERYEIRRIIRAKLSADDLVEIKEKLAAHLQETQENAMETHASE